MSRIRRADMDPEIFDPWVVADVLLREESDEEEDEEDKNENKEEDEDEGYSE